MRKGRYLEELFTQTCLKVLGTLILCNSLWCADACCETPLAISGPDAPTDGSQYTANGGVAPYRWGATKGSITQNGVVIVSGQCGTAIVTVNDSRGATAKLRIRMPQGSWYSAKPFEHASCRNQFTGCDWPNCGTPESFDTMCKFSWGAASCVQGGYYCYVCEFLDGFRRCTQWGGRYISTTEYYGVTGNTIPPFAGAIPVSASLDEWRCIQEANCTDADGDYHYAIADGCPTGDDCNDAAPSVFHGATELTDTMDNNCDGQVDKGIWGDSSALNVSNGSGCP